MNDIRYVPTRPASFLGSSVHQSSVFRLLLEEQTSRNTLLEKKQRKFDAEIGLLNEAKRHEEAAKDKVTRECDQLKANKFQLEDQVQVY